MDKPIAYEPHPVTPERKAELIEAGFKIIDAQHKPQDDGDGKHEKDHGLAKRGRKPKQSDE